jgi:hypothetical protein
MFVKVSSRFEMISEITFLICLEFIFLSLLHLPVVTHADTRKVPRIEAANLKCFSAIIKMIAPIM